MRLYINNYFIQLGDENRLAQTKQVNDLISINTRKTSITNAIKVPRTSSNEKAFQLLGIVGNNSQIPYQKNEIYLYSNSGECFVYKGRCVILDTFTDYYNIQIIDGNIDLYKAIEGTKLGDLPLDEINHFRTLENITDSWNESLGLNYKYIVSDFNGKTFLDEGFLNADYLTPFVKVSYLWEKIHSFYGFEFEGTAFDTENFTGLWMSYPKGVESSEVDNIDVFDTSDYNLLYRGITYSQTALRFPINSFSYSDLYDIIEDSHLQVKETGNYKLTISGNVRTRAMIDGGTSQTPKPITFFIGKNQQYTPHPDKDTPVFKTVINPVESEEDFEITISFQLNALDSINLMAKRSAVDGWDRFRLESPSELTLKLVRVEGSDIDFEKALVDFNTKDFMSEILNRFSLIPIKDKYSNLYRYYTLSQILNSFNTLDWSSRFDSEKGESYIYSSYARQNFFKYKYNDKEGDYNDGFISVSNENLDEKITLFQSNAYSPEKTISNIFGTNVNVFKMWDKDVKDDGSVEYKPLDKRFYIVKYITKDASNPFFPKFIKSEYSEDIQEVNLFPLIDFSGLDFETILTIHYPEITKIINKSLIKKTLMNLTDKDVSDMDFSRLIYVKQLGGSFFVNKISNYIKGKKTDVELVRINLPD